MTQASSRVREVDVIRVPIDYGSAMLKVAAQHFVVDHALGGPIDDILLDDRKQLEQIMVRDDDGLICGLNAVRNWAATHPDRLNEILEYPKLCLCAKYKDTPTARRVCDALSAKYGDIAEVQELIAAQMVWIKQAVLSFYRNQHIKGRRYPQEYWDAIRIECMITVPCMWDESARGVMRNAAASAGVSNIAILLEPLSVAAVEMDKMRGIGDIGANETVAFLDIGHSTADLASVMETASKSNDRRSSLRIVGTPFGDDVGAQVLHVAAEEAMIQKCQEMYGGCTVADVCRRLGNMPEHEFLRRFSEAFGLRKKGFPGEQVYHVSVSGMPEWWNIPGAEGDVTFKFSE